MERDLKGTKEAPVEGLSSVSDEDATPRNAQSSMKLLVDITVGVGRQANVARWLLTKLRQPFWGVHTTNRAPQSEHRARLAGRVVAEGEVVGPSHRRLGTSIGMGH